jgi:hypothetical protein
MEYLIAGLLTVIAGSELYRTYLGKRKSTRKDHMNRRLQGTRETIWDLQFKVFKTREIREEIRQEYDMTKSRLAVLEDQIAKFPADKDQGDKARLEDDKIRATNDANRYLAQMKELDLEVEGSKKTNEYPDGVNGITHNIDSLRELETMISDYVKTI